MEYYDAVREANEFLSSKIERTPSFSITLGTGLTQVLSSEVKVDISIPYTEIPHFPVSTVKGHSGEVVFGSWRDADVVFMSGRHHYYEGYSMKEVTFPIRVMGLLGVEHFIFTNVAGGVNPSYEAGDIVIVDDHIYMMADNPLRGANDDRFGPRFPDMSDVYNLDSIAIAQSYCLEASISHHLGTYYCLQGPSLETPAEYENIYRSGADLVGMSTIPEVIVAKHMGKKINVFSIVSNVCYPKNRISKTTIDQVIEVAEQATPAVIGIIEKVICN